MSYLAYSRAQIRSQIMVMHTRAHTHTHTHTHTLAHTHHFPSEPSNTESCTLNMGVCSLSFFEILVLKEGFAPCQCIAITIAHTFFQNLNICIEEETETYLETLVLVLLTCACKQLHRTAEQPQPGNHFSNHTATLTTHWYCGIEFHKSKQFTLDSVTVYLFMLFMILNVP